MKNAKYTISDVALELGVSRSTVSKAINNLPGVGDELRTKILDFVDKIGYKPNIIPIKVETPTASNIGLSWNI